MIGGHGNTYYGTLCLLLVHATHASKLRSCNYDVCVYVFFELCFQNNNTIMSIISSTKKGF